MDWQLVASYFTVKSTEIFYSVISLRKEFAPWEQILSLKKSPFLERLCRPGKQLVGTKVVLLGNNIEK